MENKVYIKSIYDIFVQWLKHISFNSFKKMSNQLHDKLQADMYSCVTSQMT